MNKEKLYNRITHDCKKCGAYTRKKFSRKYIRDVFSRYELVEYVINNYCCDTEDSICWQDEEFGWAYYAAKEYSKNPTKTAQFNLLKCFLGTAKEVSDIYNRHIYIIEDKKEIMICLPLRDVKRCDFWLSFEK